MPAETTMVGSPTLERRGIRLSRLNRNTRELADRSWDLLVIGGGVYGSWIALDASLRGLQVALIERGDFASQTSANSLKIIHGGFRYLKRADLRRLRRSAREMGILLRAAPHLVSLLQVTIAAGGSASPSRAALAASLRLYRALTRNDLRIDGREVLPPGGTLTSAEFAARFPEVSGDAAGGAYWYDAIVYDSERLVISVLRKAADAGASVSNYVEATRLLARSGRVRGVEARDTSSGDVFEIRASAVANASGPWITGLVDTIAGPARPIVNQYKAIGFNLVVNRPLADAALGLPASPLSPPDPFLGAQRFLFLVPWRDRTLLGTAYRDGQPSGEPAVGEEDLRSLVDEFNAAAPGLELSWKDVCFAHQGFLPLKAGFERGRATALAEHNRVVDHSRDGASGLVSIIGTKYTTARRGAELVVDRVFRLRGQTPPPPAARDVRLWGAEEPLPSIHEARELISGETGVLLDESAAERLARSYGSGLPEVLRHAREEPDLRGPLAPGSEHLRCEIAHAVRDEMARTLSDVVFRRTGLGSVGCPAPKELGQAAAIMAGELNWDESRTLDEIQACMERFGHFASATATLRETAGAAAGPRPASVRNPRLHVLLIAPHPFFTLRGTPIAERELLRTLSSHGYKIDVLTYPYGEDPEIENCRIHRVPRVSGVGAAPPGFSFRKLVYDPILLLSAFRLARRLQPDLIHAVEEAAFIGIVLRRLLGIPFVYDMDSSLPEQLLYRYPWLRPAARLLRWFERQAIRESMGVLTVCKSLEQLTLRHSPNHLVQRAEDVTLLGGEQAEPEDLRATTASEGPIVLYVGNLQPYQGIPLLLEGFRQTLADVPDAHLVIIGGVERTIEHHRKLAEELKIGDRVHFMGARSPDLLAGYLRQAQVLVSPRATGTNTPMKIYSYLDSGRPVVATRLPTHTQILDDEIAILVEPQARAFGRGITRALMDVELADRLARAARERVQREFTPEAHRRKVLAFYDELASARLANSHGPPLPPVFQHQ